MADFSETVDIALNQCCSPACLSTILDAVQHEAKERHILVRCAAHRLSILDLKARGYSNILIYCSSLPNNPDNEVELQLRDGLVPNQVVDVQLEYLILAHPHIMQSPDPEHVFDGLRDDFLRTLAVKHNTKLIEAADLGDVTLMRYLYANNLDVLTNLEMVVAASHGDHEMVKFLHHLEGIGCTTQAMDLAAECGHLSVVAWLHTNRTEGCTAGAMDNAAESGFLTVIQYLHANRTEGCTQPALQNAIDGGHYSTVQFLVANRTEVNLELCLANKSDYSESMQSYLQSLVVHLKERGIT
eukprot:gene17190-20482_t